MADIVSDADKVGEGHILQVEDGRACFDGVTYDFGADTESLVEEFFVFEDEAFQLAFGGSDGI